MEHDSNDECAKYLPEHHMRVVGYRETVIADDIEAGDFVQDPARDGRDQWYEVVDVWEDDEGDVHLMLEEASSDDVAQAREDACEGHETTRGAIGDTFRCDGSCVS